MFCNPERRLFTALRGRAFAKFAVILSSLSFLLKHPGECLSLPSCYAFVTPGGNESQQTLRPHRAKVRATPVLQNSKEAAREEEILKLTSYESSCYGKTCFLIGQLAKMAGFEISPLCTSRCQNDDGFLCVY